MWKKQAPDFRPRDFNKLRQDSWNLGTTGKIWEVQMGKIYSSSDLSIYVVSVIGLYMSDGGICDFF